MKDKSFVRPELMSPAGDRASLVSAVEAGCDAVYFGVKGINMRHSASNFEILELKKVMEFLHEKGKKGYLALNVIVYDGELDKVRQILEEAAVAGVDAVILWDMAVMSIAMELGLEVHLSTQASVSNFEAVKYYASIGVKRIVLARECTLEDIKNINSRIKKEKIDCEVEVFIHGAMCVSISGRCFLSHLSFNKSANKGECLQPCRREFRVTDASEGQDEECDYVVGKDYILSPKDLCTVMFLEELIEAGIAAFKIEGRMRSPEYSKVVTSVYKEAIDAYFEGDLTEDLKEKLLDRLGQSFNRGFSGGFFFGSPDDLGGKLEKGYEKTYIGEVIKFYKKIGVAEIMVKAAPLRKGQQLLITGNSTPAEFFTADDLEIEHKTVDEVPQGTAVGVKVPFTVRRNDKVFIWESRE